jgi:hypothetical protein
MKREDEFDGWLESELRRRLDPRPTSVPIARYQKERNRRGQMPKFVTGLVAALATKGAVGLTVAALAAGATGAAVVVGVSTGALSPSGFNESMKTTVQDTCKPEAAAAGEHGIGACVSSFARKHGSAARENNPGKGDKNTPGSHATKSPKSGDDQGDVNDDQNDGGADNGHAGDHHGPPTSVPTHHSGEGD